MKPPGALPASLTGAPMGPAQAAQASPLPPDNSGKQLGTEDMVSPHSGMRSSLTPGPILARVMGNYSKNPPAYLNDQGPDKGMAPATNVIKGMRGGQGAMRRRVSQGGLGTKPSPGKM